MASKTLQQRSLQRWPIVHRVLGDAVIGSASWPTHQPERKLAAVTSTQTSATPFAGRFPVSLRLRMMVVDGGGINEYPRPGRFDPAQGGSTFGRAMSRKGTLFYAGVDPGLPPGSGTPAQGARIYVEKCALCHGADGKGGVAGVVAAPLVGGESITDISAAMKRIANFWPYATTLSGARCRGSSR
jgi:mono/diheme cytochrome c family protein